MDDFTKVDKFSNLPIHLVILIISSLSLADAFRLCAARKEWFYENLWRHCTSVDLHEASFTETARRSRLASIGQGSRANAARDFGKRRYVLFLHSTLAQIISPVLSTFKLQFSYERMFCADITHWIASALSKRVENLYLDFSDLDPLRRGLGMQKDLMLPEYILPQVFFENGKSVKVLSLTACCLFYFYNFYSFKTLTVLVMKRVVIASSKVSDSLLDCPFLEELLMIDCYGLCKIEFCFGLERLKRLVVRNCEPLSRGIELVYVPKLEYFEYQGNFVRFEVEGLDELREVLLDFQIADSSYQPCDLNDMREALYGFMQAMFITISMPIFKVFPAEYMTYPPLLYLENLSKLTLITCMSKYELPGILSLLRSAPHLTSLSISSIYTFMWPGVANTNDEYDDYFELPEEFWTLPDWNLNNLKDVEIVGLTGKEGEYDTLKFLMKNAINLNKVTLKTQIRSEHIIADFRQAIEQMEVASESMAIEWCIEQNRSITMGWCRQQGFSFFN